MQSILPMTDWKPIEEDRVTFAAIDVEYAKSNHAAFKVDNEMKRSLTLGKLLEHLGFALKPGDRFRVAVALVCALFFVFGFAFRGSLADDDCPFTVTVGPAQALPRGAHRSPAHRVLTAPTHQVQEAPPPQFALVPKRLDMWGNDRYGDCVTAEEAFAKACYDPEIFVAADTAIAWARSHGYLNGADLVSVMTSMQKDGFRAGSQQYDDGGYASVDYSNETVLQSAIATSGPVKIAIDASALPKSAGSQQGWYAIAGGRWPNTDHCVSICGYGSAEYLYSQISTPLPAALPGTTSGYLVFTWSTIGFVSHDWLMGTCAEAWVRNPTTVGVPPIGPTPPAPTPTPTPPTPGRLTFAELMQLLVAKFFPRLTAAQSTGVADFFSDDNSPRVELLKHIVYRRAVQAGVIPAGTDIGAVNWQNVIQLIVELEPLIVPLIPLLFADEHAAAAATHVALCSAEKPTKKQAPKKPTPKYRKECGPRGCKMVPVEKPRFKLFRSR